MTQIAEWLKHLIAMVILAGFLELVLPDNQLKSVTKLILGLAIILFLLRPLSNFYQLPVAVGEVMNDIFTYAPSSPATDKVIQDGMRLRQQWQQDFERAARQRSDKPVASGRQDDDRAESKTK